MNVSISAVSRGNTMYRIVLITAYSSYDRVPHLRKKDAKKPPKKKEDEVRHSIRNRCFLSVLPRYLLAPTLLAVLTCTNYKWSKLAYFLGGFCAAGCGSINARLPLCKVHPFHHRLRHGRVGEAWTEVSSCAAHSKGNVQQLWRCLSQPTPHRSHDVGGNDPRFERLPCTHTGTYADDCIVERVKQHKCYIVATCDRDLKRRIRKIPGVPIMYIRSHKYSIERLPEATMGGCPAT
eukprot:1195062-Prorocentrum_minimum.AAC.1